MSTDEYPQPSLQAWMDFAAQKLSPGSSASWEWEPLEPVIGWLGDRLELIPAIHLKRFVDTVDVTLGCRVAQRSSIGVQESACVLTHYDLLYLLAMTEGDGCDRPDSRHLKSLVVRTRSGFVLEWTPDSPYVAVSAACLRQVRLKDTTFGQLRQEWLQCLEILQVRTP